MTQIELIKQEIERRIQNFSSLHNTAALKKDDEGMVRIDCALGQLRNILSFIESLEKEPEVDLEKELNEWRHEHFKGKRDGDYSGEYLERESQLSIARHFYKLGIYAKDNAPKIKGWVARDEDATLNFFSSECGDGEPIYDTESGTWGNATGEKIEIVHPSGAFGDLSFTDEPIEVELTIHRV